MSDKRIEEDRYEEAQDATVVSEDARDMWNGDAERDAGPKMEPEYESD